jgi:cytochrome c oxidase subunit 4
MAGIPAEHGHAVPRGATRSAQYVVVFAVLCALTLVEVGVATTDGIAQRAAVLALVTIAIAKAALIALFYMHLRFETRILRWTVLGPLVAPAAYGVILMAEAGTRALR